MCIRAKAITVFYVKYTVPVAHKVYQLYLSLH